MKILRIFSIAVLGFVLTGCLDHDDDATEISKTFTYDNCFAVVQDMITGEKTICQKPKVTVNMVQSNSKFTGQITLTNFELPDMPNYTYELPEISVTSKTDDHIMWLEGAQVVPTNLSGASVVLSNLRLGILQLGYTLNGEIVTRVSYSLHFEYNGKYRVDLFPLQQTMYAETAVCPQSDPSALFTTKSTTYVLNFDAATQKCAIEVRGAKFINEMPAMDMKFPGIDFTANNGSLYLESAALTPTIREVEYPQFPITNLSGTFTPLKNSTLKFECNPAGRGLFDVNAALQYAGNQ